MCVEVVSFSSVSGVILVAAACFFPFRSLLTLIAPYARPMLRAVCQRVCVLVADDGGVWVVGDVERGCPAATVTDLLTCTKWQKSQLTGLVLTVGVSLFV